MEEDKSKNVIGTLPEERRGAKNVDYFIENCFRHVFHVLDLRKEGSINKSSLQVICANICRVLDIIYMPEHLGVVNGDSVKQLDEEAFLGYFRQLVRKAVVAGNKIDFDKLTEVSWVIINKARSQEGRVLSGDDTFLLLKVFNKVDLKGDLLIHKDETAIIFEDFMKAIGTPWTLGPMQNYSESEFWTFWDVLGCLETKYIQSTPHSLYKEGLKSISDTYIHEILKTGNLIKKGHKVKSLKDRWFVLQPKKLTYYATKSMRELKGVITINRDTKVENIPDSKSGKCRFSITCGVKQIEYEIEAATQREKNEWINLIQASIDSKDGSVLYDELLKRRNERVVKQNTAAEEEQILQQKESLIKQQSEELKQLKIAQEKAEAHAETEAVMREQEQKRREELEILKNEFEKLFEEERAAREEEELARRVQENILEEERQKRKDLESIKAMQEELLKQEIKQREGLEEESKEQAKALEEERQKLKELDEARKKAEEAIAEAHAKLEAAEEERKIKAEAVESAKNKTRRMQIPEGLAKPLQVALQGFVTHRGAGAFVDEDFKKKDFSETEQERHSSEPVNKTLDDGTERAIIVESNLVKPSEKGTFLKDE